MNMIRLTTALLLLAAFAACKPLTPKAYDLRRVHEIYIEEWADHYMPTPGSDLPKSPSWSGSGFARSLTAIREYKARYGGDSREAAHLTVLTGMIYLQSGQPGMARLLKNDIATSVQKLQAPGGKETRDSLFAQCYPDLILGWEEVWKFFDGNKDTEAKAKNLDTAANGIGTKLKTVKDQDRAVDPELDSGATYLSTTAAIFFVWADSLRGLVGHSDRKAAARKGRILLERFLTDEEKADAAFLTGQDQQGKGRLRYLEWYAWLVKAEAGSL